MCRSSHFQSEGVKSLRTGGGGVKTFRTGGGGYQFGGYFCWGGGSVPHLIHAMLKLYVDEDISVETGMESQILISIMFCTCTSTNCSAEKLS